MAEKTYIVKSSRLGVLRNQKQVDEAALEGRNVTPISDYYEQGQEVKLDSSADRTKKLLDTGSIEEKSSSKSG